MLDSQVDNNGGNGVYAYGVVGISGSTITNNGGDGVDKQISPLAGGCGPDSLFGGTSAEVVIFDSEITNNGGDGVENDLGTLIERSIVSG